MLIGAYFGIDLDNPAPVLEAVSDAVKLVRTLAGSLVRKLTE